MAYCLKRISVTLFRISKDFFCNTIKMTNKQLILGLLRSDLINSKLIYSLGDLGIHAEDYLTNISEIVFELMGVEDEKQLEELTFQYTQLMQKAKAVDVCDLNDSSQKLANKIYLKLFALKASYNSSHYCQKHSAPISIIHNP